MSEPHNDPFVERLLDLEAQEPALRRRYGAVLDKHLNDHLSQVPRVRFAAVGLAGLVGSVVCGSLAITEPATMPLAVRALLVLLAFFGLAWCLLGAWVLVRGRGNFIDHRMIAARMAFGFTLASVVALALASSLAGRAPAAMPMVATGLAMLILASVILIDARLERSESLQRELILRLESRLAALNTAITNRGGDRA